MKLKHTTKLYFIKFQSFTPLKKLATLLLSLCIVVGIVWISMILFRYIHNYEVLHNLSNVKTVMSHDVNKEKVLTQISKLFPLEEQTPLVVGSIKDVRNLKGISQGIGKGRDTDIIVIYPDLYLVYDPATNTIVDIEKKALLE